MPSRLMDIDQNLSQYSVVIKCSSSNRERNATVEGYLPEELETGFSSTWDSIIPEVISGTAKGVASQLTGVTWSSRMISPQSFESNSPISISLPISFRAKTDPRTEVIDRVKSLMKMSVPAERESRSPGALPKPAKAE
jgi:hypothetical protein